MLPDDHGPSNAVLPEVSVLIPASNEEALIGRCLESVIASHWTKAAGVETIVISNGSSDRTTEIAREFCDRFRQKGWELHVLDRAEGGKLGALNAGDHIARGAIRVYLDADVMLSEDVLSELHDALDVAEPRYSSGSLTLMRSKSWVTRAYARVYTRVPFMRYGVPGAGLFAVNAAGRLRWSVFPSIISDDTFVRLSFRQDERIGVSAPYEWPLVDGWSNLVRVRRRQNAGVDEIKSQYPELMKNDDKPDFPIVEKLKIALSDPIGFAVYSGVALAVRLSPAKTTAWSRGR